MMSNTMEHHHKLTNGVGKCSVPMYSGGTPAGFCNEPAFGEYIDGERYPRASHIRQELQGERMDGKFDGYVPGLACSAHGGPKCPGLEIELGVWSGCNAHTTGAKDCPTCGDLKG